MNTTSKEMATNPPESFDLSPMALMFDPNLSTRVLAIAETMAAGSVTVPEHLRGSKGDCVAITMQALTWQMNPWAVAQKTHVVHGALGYEAQLVAAVLSSSRAIEGRLAYAFFGDWQKTERAPIIRDGAKGKYPTKGWRDEDETGLGVIVSGKARGDEERRELRIELSRIWPRNSGLWATDPQQQICYLAAKRWARRYCPDAILGVYTPDELQERTIDAEVVPDQSQADASFTPDGNKPRGGAAVKALVADSVGKQEKQAPAAGADEERKFPYWVDSEENWCDANGELFSEAKFSMNPNEDRPSVTPMGAFYKAPFLDTKVGSWFDSAEEMFDNDQHGWDRKNNRPSVTSEGVFRKRRTAPEKPAEPPPDDPGFSVQDLIGMAEIADTDDSLDEITDLANSLGHESERNAVAVAVRIRREAI